MKQASTGLVACCNSFFLNASCLHFYVLPSTSFSFLSLQFTSFELSPFLRLTSLRSSPNWTLSNFLSAPARPSVVVHGPACLLIYFVSKFWLRVSIKCDGESWVGGGIRSCALSKEWTKSFILPQDHGVLAPMVKSNFCVLISLLGPWPFKINVFKLNKYFWLKNEVRIDKT